MAEHPNEPMRVRSREGVGGKHFWCLELKSSVHGKWMVVSEHRAHGGAKRAQKKWERDNQGVLL